MGKSYRKMSFKPELSIIIPTLNEEDSLQRLLATLALQDGVEMEVIIADGGSDDFTCRVAKESGLRVSLLSSSRGRALQLNSGAAAAIGDYLLFLHADSGFIDRRALRMALDALWKRSMEMSGSPFAGHFALKFTRRMDNSRLGYNYLESKAVLNRRGCSHGDQGILIPAGLFRKHGGFDESCQILAETRFADSLRENGEWLLLPAVITTSARRFEKEGLKERQILNAAIMALGAIGREELLDLQGIYNPQQHGSKLQLQPIFREIEQKVSALEAGERTDFWEKVGKYICENAWQIPLLADFMVNYSFTGRGKEGRNHSLEIYDRYLHRLFDNRIAARLAAWASRAWLRYMAR